MAIGEGSRRKERTIQEFLVSYTHVHFHTHAHNTHTDTRRQHTHNYSDLRIWIHTEVNNFICMTFLIAAQLLL